LDTAWDGVSEVMGRWRDTETAVGKGTDEAVDEGRLTVAMDRGETMGRQ